MEFRKMELGELCNVVTDYVANGSFKSLADNVKYSNSGYAQVIRLVDYNNKYSLKDSIWVSKEGYDYLKKSKLYGGEIIITNVGANLGTVFIAPTLNHPMTLGPNAVMLKSNEDDLYLYYWLISPEGRNKIKAIVTGSAMPKFNKTDLKKVKIPVPNLDVQKKISKFLQKIDQKIKLNNQINDNLQEIIKEYYFNLIKDDFKEISLAELMDYQGGSQPPASEFQYEKSSENIRFVQIRDFDTSSHICYIPVSNKNKLCKKDDILIARYGASLGRICYGLDGAYNVALAKVLPKDKNYKEIIRVILESKEFYEYINSVGQRSAQAGFNSGDIQAFRVKIPINSNKIIAYNEFAKKCLNKRLLNIEENNRLVKLRDTLLPKLMNGEIDLDKIEI